jgi:hypothetical protein
MTRSSHTADLRRSRALRERRLPFRPTLRFLYSYVLSGPGPLRRGFLDGYAGDAFCRLLASYEMPNVFKAYELRRQGTIRFRVVRGSPSPIFDLQSPISIRVIRVIRGSDRTSALRDRRDALSYSLSDL